MAKPIAVIAGDIHYSLKTLARADASTRLAIAKANELKVPFIANGDTHNDKAQLRGECVNALIETFKLCDVPPIVNVGNHCRLSERAPAHSLNFLAPYAMVIDNPKYVHPIGYIVPYFHDTQELLRYLETVPKGSTLIMHQGIMNSAAGEYFQDHSAIPKEALKDFRTILSHYHTRQDVTCGPSQPNSVGLASYIGNPYTLNYGEAKDPEKGFQVLYQDGSLEFVPTNLGSHRVMELTYVDELRSYYGERPELKDNDILKVKIKGPSDKLSVLTKDEVRAIVKFDDIVVDFEPYDIDSDIREESLPQPEIFDSVIDGVQNIDVERKERLKKLWRTFA